MYLRSMAVKNAFVFFEGCSKMMRILLIPFAKRSQCSHKERSRAKACNGTLKVPNIKRRNLEPSFSKSPYFFANIIFAILGKF